MTHKIKLVKWLNGVGLGPVLSWVRLFQKKSFIISYPKCGRTWVGTVMMHYVGRVKGLLDEAQDFSVNPSKARPDLFRLNRSAVFTHDVSTGRRTPEELTVNFSLKKYEDNPIVFLIRDPRDVLVSYYHHILKRNYNNLKSERKKGPSLDTSINEFVHMPAFGLARLITFYNLLADFERTHASVRFFRYEDLRGNDAHQLKSWSEMFAFIFQAPIDLGALEWSLEINAFEKMKYREQQVAANSNTGSAETNANLRRVRGGKVGGYKEEMGEDTIAFINSYIEEHLSDYFNFYKGT
jgi:Sulfotransferase domain